MNDRVFGCDDRFLFYYASFVGIRIDLAVSVRLTLVADIVKR